MDMNGRFSNSKVNLLFSAGALLVYPYIVYSTVRDGYIQIKDLRLETPTALVPLLLLGLVLVLFGHASYKEVYGYKLVKVGDKVKLKPSAVAGIGFELAKEIIDKNESVVVKEIRKDSESFVVKIYDQEFIVSKDDIY